MPKKPEIISPYAASFTNVDGKVFSNAKKSNPANIRQE